MNWKGRVNVALARTTGLELRRIRAPKPRPRRRGAERRLLEAPAFVICSVRSGSTLLRVLLDSHSLIHSPQELHLRDLAVSVKSDYARKALTEIGLAERELEYLLWDRLLHRELEQSRKSILVNKTPNDVFIVDRILECWPDARFIYLLRHPLAIARSRHQARPHDSDERNLKMVRRYGDAIERARAEHPGITVRYEELASDPARATQEVCAFLGVGWEPEMLDYGRYAHGRYKPGLGDWSDNIRSGRVQPPAPLPAPEEVPEALRSLCAAWGYPAPASDRPAAAASGPGGPGPTAR